MPSQKPTFLLAHGAWHKPEAYRFLLRALESRGYPTAAPELPSGMDQTPADPPGADARCLRDAARDLIGDGKELVVIAHSYGGAVVAEAFNGMGVRERQAKGLTGGVRMIVRIAAFVLEQGKSFEDYVPVDSVPWTHYKGDMKVITPGFDIGKICYDDVPKEVQQKFSSSLTNHPKACSLYSPKEPRYNEIDQAYVYCEQDVAFPLIAQQFMVGNIKNQGVSFKEASLSSSHFPMLSMPEELADKIVEFL
ncbi:putative hydrolase R7-like protein [Cladobotryum mycophilum]|uniref:Hydrolase R7-like protein n=1 Tax=Cladobotryum mycophilum TaxID=491253 RepID=A0ABR0SHI1_9HYPO